MIAEGRYVSKNVWFDQIAESRLVSKNVWLSVVGPVHVLGEFLHAVDAEVVLHSQQMCV